MAKRAVEEDQLSRTAGAIRREIGARNLLRAASLVHEVTYGDVPSVLYQDPGDGTHGNFFPASYRRICARPGWAQRLNKAYTASSRIARGGDRSRAELDCANSSDALLMNIFCAPRTMASRRLQTLLTLQPGTDPEFGVRVMTPLRGDLHDRTEIDMRCGDLLVEAKLGESGFGTARGDLLHRYLHFEEVFDTEALSRTRGLLRNYQLLRGVLAVADGEARFALFCDERRPDLREEWFRTLAAVRSTELRSRLLIVTWQEIAACLSGPLQNFLAVKYGIGGRPAGPQACCRPPFQR